VGEHAVQLKTRIERLDALMRGLAKEVLVVQESNDPLLLLERQAYLGALHDAIQGLDAVRVMLVRAVQRIEGDRR
jgi:hypothetical protein